MGAYYKDKGISIYRALEDIYKKYGYYDEKLVSITLKGREGIELINKVMTVLRQAPPRRVGIEDVSDILDYAEGIKNLPKSDVLQFITNKSSIISIRPSGTEPKVKIYFSARGKTYDDTEQRLSSLVESFTSTINKILQ
jgi:phosphoglucomutase